MTRMKTSEKRFREGKGVRFLKDGVTVRCHAVTKEQMDRSREEAGDPDLDSSDVWPEGQCSKAAEPGTFLCHFHGGKTPNSAHNPLAAFMPIDLAQKIEIIASNGDYLSRRGDINALMALNAQLFERMGGADVLHPAVRTKLEAVVEKIKNNALIEAINDIQSLLDKTYDEKELRAEVRENMSLLKGMTQTQVTTAKELRLMATTDSVTNIVMRIFDSITKNSQKYIPDAELARPFLLAVAGDIRRLVNAGDAGTSLSLGDGSE
jgi:hypothetical protein